MTNRVAIHQPDLLPWSGFWYKMMNVDTFVLDIHDQLQKHWVQRRVMMRDSWVSLPLVGKPRPDSDYRSRSERRVAKSTSPTRFVVVTSGPNTGSHVVQNSSTGSVQLMSTCWPPSISRSSTRCVVAWDRHHHIVITDPPVNRGVDRVLEQLQISRDVVLIWLGRQGGDISMRPPKPSLRTWVIELVWTAHQKTTGDSLVTILMDYDDPMEIISLEASPA
ncbi:MAG: WbqC family protein [Marmoricola sp.]